MQHEAIDTLREVAGVGAGHALSAFADLVRKKLVPDVPTLESAESLPDDPDAALGVRVGLASPYRFDLMLVFDDASARMVIKDMCRLASPPTELGPLEESALKELGNIVASAFLGAVSAMTQKKLLPSTPELIAGTLGSLRPATQTGDEVICVCSEFSTQPDAYRGRLYVAAAEDVAARMVHDLQAA